MKIEKSEGFNETEKLLGELCNKTFLNLWTYLNVYKKDGKELCDAIAVFENHVFLFFDRNKETFKNSEKSLEVLWKRWKKDAIDKQINSVIHAEKYILKADSELFLDPKCEKPFPIQIPKADEIQIHKIIIAHGAGDAAQKFFGSASGALIISYEPDNNNEKPPFFISLKSEDKIHVFDSANIELIFNELDTIFDFREYIVAKEAAIKKYNSLFYCAEEDLLAHYYFNYDVVKKKHFIGVKKRGIDGLSVSEGEWESYANSAHYRDKHARKQKYKFWDVCIQHVSDFHLKGEIEGEYSLYDNETPLLEMAKEPRFVRTQFSQQIQNSIQNFPNSDEDEIQIVKSYFSSGDLSKFYILLQYKGVDGLDNVEMKREILWNICHIMNALQPNITKIIGIAIFAPKHYRNSATDVCQIDFSDVTAEEAEEWLNVNEKAKLVNIENFKNLYKNTSTIYEFSPHLNRSRKIGRNDPCECGSGKKYKKCCLRK